MNDLAIRVEGVGKAYRIWDRPAARLKVGLLGGLAMVVPSLSTYVEGQRRKHARDFLALDDVSFSVARGESLGIVGRNGSGKSTLLQIIAGTLVPTQGRVDVAGKVAALLELGAGFNPEYTGRENVFINAAMLGLAEHQVLDKFEEIAAFSELGDFIDQPVKTYSSGMVVRLAFSVAAHVDPDILIIDEALAVGDARFQLKCSRAIDRFRERGTTLLFVSHDLSTVKRLCRRAILLESGRLVHAGPTPEVANLYVKMLSESASPVPKLRPVGTSRGAPASTPLPEQPAPLANPAGESLRGGDESESAEVVALRLKLRAVESVLRRHGASAELEGQVQAMLADERSQVRVTGKEFRYGGEHGKIETVAITDASGRSRGWFESGEEVIVSMEVHSGIEVAEPIYAMTIKNSAGTEIYGTNTLFGGQPAGPIGAGERRSVHFRMKLNLIAGDYFLSFGFTHFAGGQLKVVERRYDAIHVEVHARDRAFGIANLDARIAVGLRPGEAGDKA